MTKVWESLRIALILMLICGLIAGVVALVNQVTFEKIEQNLEAERRNAIVSIFGSEHISYEALSDVPETAETVYTVTAGGTALGYCVNVNAGGFGGDINLMVGVGADGKIIGVSIVSLSETPGVGTKVNTVDYLSAYIGKGSGLKLGEDIDGITGATVSSKAVLAGVNAAMDTLVQMNLIGGEAA